MEILGPGLCPAFESAFEIQQGEEYQILDETARPEASLRH